MATPTDVAAIIAALAASQPAAGQQQQQPVGYSHPQTYQPQAPAAAPAYNNGAPGYTSATPSYILPQPTSSGTVNLSGITPASTGTVNFQDALAKVRGIAAEKGISYDPNRGSNGPPRQDPRLVGRPEYSQPPRSNSPSRQPFRENYNPYADERRGGRAGNNYSRDRSRSPAGRGRDTTFNKREDRGYGERDDDNQETILIDSNLVGFIIGRQGENLRRIEQESNTRIQFITKDADGMAQRKCELRGPPRARMDAKREIYRLIDENGGNTSQGMPYGSRSVTSSGSGGGGGRLQKVSVSNNQPPLREGENSVQIMVPDRTVGLIIGRGGETIRDLQERSGCHINIVGENKSINGLRPVNLIGNTQAANLAKEFILEIVDSDTRNQDQQNQAPSRPPPIQELGNRERAPGPDKITEKVHVPSESVGMIIGKGGETIKQMQNDTGCKINVTQASGADIEREIGLIGSAQAIEAAKSAIWDKVDQVKNKNDGGFGGGSGGRGGGGGRSNDRYGDNYSQQQPSYGQQSGQGMPPQAGAPSAAAVEDPYAIYGGYQNYVIMWQLAQAQQQQAAQGQQPPGGPPGA